MPLLVDEIHDPVGNAYSGNYAYGARGAAVNPTTGQAISAGRVTAGNVDTGQAGLAGYVRGQALVCLCLGSMRIDVSS